MSKKVCGEARIIRIIQIPRSERTCTLKSNFCGCVFLKVFSFPRLMVRLYLPSHAQSSIPDMENTRRTRDVPYLDFTANSFDLLIDLQKDKRLSENFQVQSDHLVIIRIPPKKITHDASFLARPILFAVIFVS